MEKIHGRTVAIDFDGVIHDYSEGYKDGEIYDPPKTGSLEGITRLLEQGYCVFILSTRKPRQIKKWLKRQIKEYNNYWPTKNIDWKVCVIPFWKKFWTNKKKVGITNKKLPALYYIDDHALLFKKWDHVIRRLT